MKTMCRLFMGFTLIAVAVLVFQGCATSDRSHPPVIPGVKKGSPVSIKTFGLITIVKAGAPTTTPVPHGKAAARVAKMASPAKSSGPVTIKTMPNVDVEVGTDFWLYFSTPDNQTIYDVDAVPNLAIVKYVNGIPVYLPEQVADSTYLVSGSEYLDEAKILDTVPGENSSTRAQKRMQIKPSFLTGQSQYTGFIVIAAKSTETGDDLAYGGQIYIHPIPASKAQQKKQR